MNLNALKQTVAPEQDPHCEEEEGRAKKRNDGKRKRKGWERGRGEKRGGGMEMEEREGGARGEGGERKVKNLHITMPEKNQNIFHRKMGHFQILVPYQTN